jgi:tetratricopeptide (TPR) repeat protein
MGRARTRRPIAAQRPPARDREGVYWVIAIVVAAVLVYANAVGNAFVLDDTRIIRDDLRIRSLSSIPGLFASPYWDLEGANALYRPLVLASYAVNYALHGLSTSGYSLVNIALHAVVSVLLFLIVREVGGSLMAAGVAGLAFAIHPVHTEAVTGIAGRTELLAATFFFLAVWFHRRTFSAGPRTLVYRVATLTCFALALLSKESAITLLLVLPMMDALRPAIDSSGQPVRLRRRILPDYLMLAVVAAAYLAVRRAVLGAILIGGGGISALDNPLVPVMTTPLGDRVGATTGQALMTAFAVVGEYARLIVWPVRLSPDYSADQIPLVTSFVDIRFLLGVALVVACLGGIAALWRRSPVAAFGLAFLALTFSVVSNFAITIGTICAERLIYLPSAGALIAAAVGIDWLLRHADTRRRIAYVALGVIATAAAARTWTRNRDWQDELTLWSAAVNTAPNSARVHGEYGRVLMDRAQGEAESGRSADAEQDYAAAQAHYETALKIYPSYAPPMDGLATILSLHERYDEALVLYARAVKVQPSNFVSVTNWGGLLWDKSRRAAVQASSLRSQGQIAEADRLEKQADTGFRQALEKVDRAIAMKPSYAHAHLVRALLLDAYVHDPAGAIAEFEEVLRLAPNHPQRQMIEEELAHLRQRPPAAVVEK